jgi:hypothetical protein
MPYASYKKSISIFCWMILSSSRKNKSYEAPLAPKMALQFYHLNTKNGLANVSFTYKKWPCNFLKNIIIP